MAIANRHDGEGGKPASGQSQHGPHPTCNGTGRGCAGTGGIGVQMPAHTQQENPRQSAQPARQSATSAPRPPRPPTADCQPSARPPRHLPTSNADQPGHAPVVQPRPGKVHHGQRPRLCPIGGGAIPRRPQ